MPDSILRVLIANRGEIAARVILACREAGVESVAAYSEAERFAPYLAAADSAVLIGGASASESYLDMDAVLAAAKAAKVNAIHPGYGFLSENAEFAARCEQAGFQFIGPPAAVIRALGDKIAAKRLMETAGVPLVPGYYGDDQSDARLQAEAESIGFPVLIKAAAGGGGRGMRVVDSADSFPALLNEARKEADAGFGDARVLLERYVERPRHIEVQIFGDTHGNVLHFFERECSIQRRHQKIIEESPSPLLTPELREKITEAAVAAGRAAGYVNAGTVEFLVEERADGNHPFYFLEVNTRLQVEHPVTEMITGIDLVKLQLRVAAGEQIPFTQAEARSSGHSIEARIYAEDPETGFLPSVGRIEQWIPPAGPWVRVDSGVERGTEVSPYYDPMLAKLVVRGENRAESLGRLERALMHFHVLGVKTNIAYLLDIVREPEFRAGRIHTGFLDERFRGWKPAPGVPDDVALVLAAERLTVPATASRNEARAESDAFNPWRTAGSWRN